MTHTLMTRYKDDRIRTLESICGLTVKVRAEKGQTVYDFYADGHTVKTCWTYPKAKVFAEGVAFSKENARYAIAIHCADGVLLYGDYWGRPYTTEQAANEALPYYQDMVGASVRVCTIQEHHGRCNDGA